MARIIGIGETVYNILMRDGQPVTAAPGGDILNTIVALGRRGHEAAFISEVGDDRLGANILAFMRASGVNTDFMYAYHDGRTPLTLTHLDTDGTTHRDAYIDYPDSSRLDIVWPRIDPGDILYFGTRYVLHPAIRTIVTDLVTYARERKAIVIYRPALHNLQPGEAVWLMPYLIENFEVADIISMDTADMQQLYKDTDVDRVYRDHVNFYCPVFIADSGAAGLSLRTVTTRRDYPALVDPRPATAAPSGKTPPSLRDTHDVADTFHAGFLAALVERKISLSSLPDIDTPAWDEIIATGREYAAAER